LNVVSIRKRIEKAGAQENTLVDKDIKDELTQRDRKHRNKYTGENK
jgi:hypothetical protein